MRTVSPAVDTPALRAHNSRENREETVVKMARDARTSEVAAAVGVSPASIQAYARAGRIPFRLTPGRQYRFNVSEVRQILAPEPVELSTTLGDVFSTTVPLVDALSGYRADPIDAASERQLRVRGVYSAGRKSAKAHLEDAGRVELGAVLSRSGCSAAAVLHRDPVHA